MKSLLILASALALTTTAALAQTVAPGTAPGAQTGNPSNMPSAGSSTDRMASDSGNGNMNNMSGSNGSSKRMHKGKKMKSSDGGMKTKTKM